MEGGKRRCGAPTREENPDEPATLKRTTLKTELRSAGLSMQGNVAELRERLSTYRAANPGEHNRYVSPSTMQSKVSYVSPSTMLF